MYLKLILFRLFFSIFTILEIIDSPSTAPAPAPNLEVVSPTTVVAPAPDIPVTSPPKPLFDLKVLNPAPPSPSIVIDAVTEETLPQTPAPVIEIKPEVPSSQPPSSIIDIILATTVPQPPPTSIETITELVDRAPETVAPVLEIEEEALTTPTSSPGDDIPPEPLSLEVDEPPAPKPLASEGDNEPETVIPVTEKQQEAAATPLSAFRGDILLDPVVPIENIPSETAAPVTVIVTEEPAPQTTTPVSNVQNNGLFVISAPDLSSGPLISEPIETVEEPLPFLTTPKVIEIESESPPSVNVVDIGLENPSPQPPEPVIDTVLVIVSEIPTVTTKPPSLDLTPEPKIELETNFIDPQDSDPDTQPGKNSKFYRIILF